MAEVEFRTGESEGDLGVEGGSGAGGGHDEHADANAVREQIFLS